MNSSDFPEPLKFPVPQKESEVIEVEGNWQIFAGRSGHSSQKTVDNETPPPPGHLLEAALFVAPKPLNAEILGRLFPGWSDLEVENLFAQLNQAFRQQGRPYRAVKDQSGWVLRLLAEALPKRSDPKPQKPGEVDLPQEAVDVLALVAYRQPIGGEEIDSVRGADSSQVIRKLLRLGLVRMDSLPNGKMYRTTDLFLETLGITSLKDLPRVEEAG